MYSWLVVAMLWFVCFLNYADRLAIFSVFPLLGTQLHLTNFELGIIGGSFMWVYALCGPFAGWLADRVSRRTLIMGALLFWSLMTAATALAHTFASLTLVRALGGLGEAFYFPSAMSMLSDYHGSATRSRAMSVHQSSVYAGSIAGGAISGYLGEYYGWKSSFLVLGASGVVLGFLLLFFLEEPARGATDIGARETVAEKPGGIVEDIRAVLSNRMAMLLVLAFIGANFVAAVFLTWMPTFLHQKFHMSLSLSGLNSTVYIQIASVLGVLTGGAVADSWQKKARGGRILAQGCGLLCGVPFLFFTGWSESIALLIGAMIGFGYFKGVYDANIFASLYDVVPVERRGTSAGILNSMGWLGGGFAPVLVAISADRYGMSASISATAVIYLMIGLLMIYAAQQLRPKCVSARD